MTRFLQICAAVAILAIAAAFFSIAWTVNSLGSHAGSTLTAVDSTLNEINRPCKGPDGPAACGVLASFNKTQNTTRNTVGQVEMIVHHFNDPKKLAAVDAGVHQLYSDAHSSLTNIDGAITDARGTITALTGTANATTGAVQEGQRTIAALQPAFAATASTIAHMDSSIAVLTPEAQRALKELADSETQGTGILADTRKVADHFEQQIDNPKKQPWYISILPATLKAAVTGLIQGIAAR